MGPADLRPKSLRPTYDSRKLDFIQACVAAHITKHGYVPSDSQIKAFEKTYKQAMYISAYDMV